MRIPEKSEYVRPWTILGQQWTVHLVKKMPDGLAGNVGYCWKDRQRILLKHNLSTVESWSVFVHEYCHSYYPHLNEDEIVRMEQVFIEFWVGL